MGSRVAGGYYGFADLDRGEKKEGVVQRAPLDEKTELAGGAGAPGGAASKLFALAMEVVLERLPLPNVIGWLGATAIFFPESGSREYNLVELSFGVAAITLSVQADLADESNSSEMRLFRMAISGF